MSHNDNQVSGNMLNNMLNNNMLNKYDEPNEAKQSASDNKQSTSDSNSEQEHLTNNSVPETSQDTITSQDEKATTNTDSSTTLSNNSDTKPTTTRNARITENVINNINIHLNKQNRYKTSNNQTYVKRKDLKQYLHVDKTGHIIFQGFSPKIQRTIRVYPEIYAIYSTLSHGTLMKTMNDALIDYLEKQGLITAKTAAQMHEANV